MIEEGTLTQQNADNVFSYNMSQSIEKQLDIDKIILSRWKTFMALGNFRYSIDSVREKILPGKFRFLVQFQPNRSTNRRPPQNMTSVCQKFNPEKFNFTKINKEKELVCELYNTGDNCGDKSELSRGKDCVIINVSPIDLGHCLLVPQPDSCLPQILTEHGIKLALEMMFLSQHNDLKIAFNSLCGYASVNHLHFHVYYQSNPLPVQHLPLTRVSSTCHVYTLAQDTYPAPAWVWLISRRDVDKISGTAAQVFKLTNWLTRQDVAHNVFITRGRSSAGDVDDTDSYIRIIVWVREAVRGAKDAGAFVMAVCELSGQMLVYSHEKYQDIDEQEIVSAMRSTTLQTFTQLFDRIKHLLLGED